MAKIIKPREKKTRTEYRLEFYDKATDEVCWGFPLLNGKGTEPVPCTYTSEHEPCTEEECTWWDNYIKAKEDDSLYSEEEKIEYALNNPGKVEYQRYKGLGEMSKEQLWDTTMNPETRTLIRVTMQDAAEADQMFSMLMGENPEMRRKFIEENAALVKDLDV